MFDAFFRRLITYKTTILSEYLKAVCPYDLSNALMPTLQTPQMVQQN